MSSLLNGLVHSLVNVASSTGGGHSGPLPLGYLVIGIIMAPVIILILATLLGEPRQTKITTIFFAFIGMMVLMYIGAVFGLSVLLALFY